MFFCPSIFQSSVGAIVGSLHQIVGLTVVFVASSQELHKNYQSMMIYRAERVYFDN